MAVLPLHNVVLEEEIDEKFEPSEEELLEYVRWLGMSLPEDQDLLWIAREGLKAPLPGHWKPCRTEDDEIYYFNFMSGDSVWEHPCDEYYRRLYVEVASKKYAKYQHSRSLESSTLCLQIPSTVEQRNGRISGYGRSSTGRLVPGEQLPTTFHLVSQWRWKPSYAASSSHKPNPQEHDPQSLESSLQILAFANRELGKSTESSDLSSPTTARFGSNVNGNSAPTPEIIGVQEILADPIEEPNLGIQPKNYKTDFL